MKYKVRCHCEVSYEVTERVVCSACQKDFTASRKGYSGDGTGGFYPRKHKDACGNICEGSYEKTDDLLTLCKEIKS
jgi:hypothetical protein